MFDQKKKYIRGKLRSQIILFEEEEEDYIIRKTDREKTASYENLIRRRARLGGVRNIGSLIKGQSLYEEILLEKYR